MSLAPTTTMHQIARNMAEPIFPVAHKRMVAGTQTRAVPTMGTMLKKCHEKAPS